MRLNFEFNDAQVENINALKEKTGAASMKELFNNALTMLEWAVDEAAQGKEIEATDGKTSRVFVTPLLRQVRLNRVAEQEPAVSRAPHAMDRASGEAARRVSNVGRKYEEAVYEETREGGGGNYGNRVMGRSHDTRYMDEAARSPKKNPARNDV